MANAKDVDGVRAFVALDLESMCVRRIARMGDRLHTSKGVPNATWTAPAHMHLTLEFFEKIDPAVARAIFDDVAPLVVGKPAPRGGLMRLDAFPSPANARVVVARAEDPQGEIARIARACEDRAAKEGVEREKRRFKPHVTIARLKRPFDARKWFAATGMTDAGECAPTELVLYRSELTAQGSVYTALARARLG